MSDSPGLKYLNEMRVGFDELAWLQAANDDDAKARRLAGSRTHGLVCGTSPHGRLGPLWHVFGNGSSLEFFDPSTPQLLVDEDGASCVWDPAEYESALPVVPDDGVWYTLVCRIKLSDYARGTIDFTTGSAALAGTDSRFTRHSGETGGENGGVGTVIRVEASDSANGNDGDYTLDTITDDTTATMTSNALGTTETGVPYKVIGTFFDTVPASPQIHLRPVVEFELVARTRTPASGDLVIADVMLDTGASADVQCIDRRAQNVWRPRSAELAQSGMILAPRIKLGTKGSGATWGVDGDGGTFPTGSGSIGQCASCVLQNGYSRAVAWEDSGTIYTAVVNHNGQATTSPTSFGSGTDPCLVRSPRIDPTSGNNGLLMFYVVAGAIYMSVSTDNGVTWGTGSKVFDPLAVDPADTAADPDAIFLPNGRLVVACTYDDDSASATSIVSFYSDDYTDSWDTNSNAGHTLVSSSLQVNPALWVNPEGTALVLACESSSFNAISVYYGAGADADGASALTSATGLGVLGGTAYSLYDILTDEHANPAIVGDAAGNLAIMCGGIDSSNTGWLTVFHIAVEPDPDGSGLRMTYGRALDIMQIDASTNSYKTAPAATLTPEGLVWVNTGWSSANNTTTASFQAVFRALRTAQPAEHDLDYSF